MPLKDSTARKKPPQSEQSLLLGLSESRDFSEERSIAMERENARIGKLWDVGYEEKALRTARMMVLCGLPVRQIEGMSPVVRKARLGDGSQIRVTFSRSSGLVPLPFGADRTMLYFLTEKAFINDSPALRWQYTKEYMDLFGMSTGGKYYREAQERFLRVARLNIDIDHIDANGKVLTNWKSPIIDASRMAVEVDEEGNWRPSQSLAEVLAAKEAVEFGQRFFRELKEHHVPIPLQLLRAAGKQYRLMDFMVFLYWRAWAGKTVSTIPWSALQAQFDNAADSNTRRWAWWFRKALVLLHSLPWPLCEIKAEVTSIGVRIHPLPVGTQMISGHPKLGMSRKEFAAIHEQARKEQEAKRPSLPSKEATQKWVKSNKYAWKKFLSELQRIRSASTGTNHPEGNWHIRMIEIAASRSDVPKEIAWVEFGISESDFS